MTEDELYQMLERETVALEQAGGWHELLRFCDELKVLAGVKQRRFERYLDTLGEPGPIRFDPFAEELELRGHIFRAQLIGSLGNSDWLWAHRNPFLNLREESSAIANAVAKEWAARGMREAMCIDFPGHDRLEVAHRLSSLATGLGLADAYYVANQSQCYAVLSGEIPIADNTLSDLNFAITSPADMRVVSESSVARAINHLSLAVTSDEDREISVAEDGHSLRIFFDENGYVASCELTL